MNSTKDIVGGKDMTIQLNDQLVADRFNNKNSAVFINTGYGTVPSGIYFDPSTGFSIMVWLKVFRYFVGFNSRISNNLIN